MLTARCPGCGRPAPLCLANPGRLLCPACHYDGPPPPESREPLANASQLVGQLDLKKRQLTESQRRALTSAWSGTMTYIFLFGFLLLPFLGCLAFGIPTFLGHYDTNWWAAVVCSLPAILLAATGLGGLGWIVKKRHRLEEACSAIPPLYPGQPARCHVCGGDLAQSEGTKAIVRCSYCSADNLIRSKVFDRVTKKATAETGSLVDQVRDAGTQVGTATSTSVVLVTLGAFVIPVLSTCIVTFGVLAGSEDGPPDVSVEYAEVTVEERGQCLAEMHRDASGGAHLDHGRIFQLEERTVYVPDVSGYQVWTVTQLVGRRMLRPNETIGTVVSVHTTSVNDSNFARFEVEGSSNKASSSIPGLCFR